MNLPTPDTQHPTPSEVKTQATQLYASIDVGTNTVKMTIADLGNGGARCVYEESEGTRLGEGMQAQAMRLREIPMRRTVEAICRFVERAREREVLEIVAVGTAALRDAENREDFLKRVQEMGGIRVEVIPGEEEARLSYLAVRRDPQWRDSPRLIVIDIGGGSTEVIQGEANTDKIVARTSVNLGAVKLTETYLKSDPPTVAQLAAANHAANQGFVAFTLAGTEDFQVVGVGGTMTNLGGIDLGGRVEPERLHGHLLTTDALESQISLLAARTVEERKAIPGLDSKRADIILGGAILLSQALAHIGSTSLAVSTRGLRWGVLYDRFM